MIVKNIAIIILTIVLTFSLFHIVKAIIHVVHDEHKNGAKKADLIRGIREHHLNLKKTLQDHHLWLKSKHNSKKSTR